MFLSLSALIFFFTMQHVGLGVSETHSAGLQQVCRSDGRFRYRHTTQTQHLESKRQRVTLDIYMEGERVGER